MTKKDAPGQYSFPIIGKIHSCYKEKFGIPRQSGLAPAARARVEFFEPFGASDAFDGLQHCSHIWLQFVFHLSLRESWKPKVRPPRLGGNRAMGVFATRSPVRPSALGLSVVKLDAIVTENGRVTLLVSGIDLVDGTPIVDVKPYLPYVDCVTEATYSLVEQPPSHYRVIFSPESQQQLALRESSAEMQALIVQVLQQDPRPQYHKLDSDRVYGMKLMDFDLQWRYREFDAENIIEVLSLV